MSRTEEINPDESPRAAFAYLLRRLRTTGGLTQRDLADRLGYSESQIGMIEQGRRRPTQHLADLLDTEFGVEDFGQLYVRTTWAGSPEHFRAWLDEEQEATALRSWEPMLVTGLLQTEAYARALFAAEPGITPKEVDERTEARMQRQRVLTRDKPPTVTAIMDEGVLRRPVGGAEVMRNQLAHILELAQHRQISVQVVPYNAGAYAGLLGGLIIAERHGTPSTVYVESQPHGRAYEDRAIISGVLRRYDCVRSEAYPHHLSLNIIKDVMTHGPQ
ncbi:helix-turn-helix transcriptional regulator [Nonomuraea sp. NPDC049141]|uniref:helix-turn-helix domain-containing protein n=1 Tax=Nonomuraea sp. NPDC049141 TaxID=3155500 RepID=UPI0033C78955